MEREQEIQKLSHAVLELYPHSTGDSGSGAECPFCLKECRWDAEKLEDIRHELDCVVLIAKDLTTNLKST